VIYERIDDCAKLPEEGSLSTRAREKVDLDFKRFADSAKMWEHAKDLAAFANSLGGVILVGADNESNVAVLKYPGVRGQTVADVVRIYELAANLCSPSPVIDCLPLKSTKGVDLVAVNVDPYLDQMVASPGGHKTGGMIEGLWKFPIRRGSQTDDIHPKEFAMFMNRQTRRAYLMLTSIPTPNRSTVKVWFPRIDIPKRGVKVTASWELQLGAVPPMSNYCEFSAVDTVPCRVPLADVQDVWEENDALWAVKLSGTIDRIEFGSRPRLRYTPLF
jgi:hypothetical protein